MNWNVKKIEETEALIIIGFSKNSSFDGRIKYDKVKECFELISVAKDCNEFESKRLFQFLYTLIAQNRLSYNPYSIVTG